MHAYAHLLDGLTWRRAAWTAAIAVLCALLLVGFFANTYLDLLVSALCVAFSIMLAVTAAGNLRQRLVPREAAQLLAVVVGSGAGTALTGLVKGRNLVDMLSSETRLWGVAITLGLGVGFGSVAWLVAAYREQKASAMAESLRREAERQRMDKQILQARLRLMQAQVEPHFLFNTLANVRHLVEADPPAAARMLDSLIAYLRAALPRMREETTTLGREFELARAYLEIIALRMGGRLAFRMDLPAALGERAFPPMMLLSLVENAVKHGIDPSPDGGEIAISAREREGRLQVRVADTGRGLGEGAGASGTGLSNIRERLAALHGADARLRVEGNAPRGVVATVELPPAAGGHR